MRPRKVCICRSVTENMILEAIERGARTFEDVQNVTGCSTGCGTCESSVRSIIEKKLTPT
ncbi:MAG: (2Fe-2S)-binding protein [Spirochaetia bacterium]|nr:(2Fe-2S)-binding protein [Spirochaetia bacterium]